MSPMPTVNSIAERYDRSLRYAHGKKLSADTPQPRPTRFWPLENIALLERYQTWRLQGGASEYTTNVIYVPMAGHALGLALKPFIELDLEEDLAPAYDYILAKELSPEWTKVCRNALENFRKFLRQERGLPDEVKRRPDLEKTSREGLPRWLVRELHNYQLVRQRNWRPARLEQSIRSFWSHQVRIWRYLVATCGVNELADLRRQHVYDYLDHRLGLGRAVSGVNSEVRGLVAFLTFLQEQGYTVPQALLRVPNLPQPQRLPQFLTDEQVVKLREDFEARVGTADTLARRRDALLDRAAFYLLWQGGLRISEVEELRLEDLDFASRRVLVRRSKGLKDRAVYLSEGVVHSLKVYLAVRGPAPTDHVFIYRNRALRKDLVRARIKAAGKRVGVRVHPQRLRHTCATQLLNAGCKITSIQRFLGHKKLSTTMIYARVHDQTVSRDYYEAMAEVEQQLELVEVDENEGKPLRKDERTQLLKLTERLITQDMCEKEQLEIARRIQALLVG